MRDVVIDVRCLQDSECAASVVGRRALALLREARAALPGDVLVGLIDPSRPVPGGVRAQLDTVRGTGYTGTMRRPTCFVQLAPLAADPIAVARLLLHEAVRTATVLLPPEGRRPTLAEALADEVGRRWWGRYDVKTVADRTFWPAVRALAPVSAPAAIAGQRARLAVLTTDPGQPLVAALAGFADVQAFSPDQKDGPLSPRFDRVLSLIANTPRHAGLVASVARFGGAALVRDSSLLAAYDAPRAASLAEAELGRRVSERDEVERWRRGEIRAPALLLGEVAAAAEPLLVHAKGLALRVRERFGADPVVAPLPIRREPAVRLPPESLVRVTAIATGGQAVACIWALEMLRSWGVDARLSFVGESAPALVAPAQELGLGERVAFTPTLDAAHVVLALPILGQAGVTEAAVVAARGMPCVASRAAVEGWEAPAWVRPLPDEPSPPLLAEAILAAIAREPDPEALEVFVRNHDPTRCARLVCEAMGLGA